MGETPVLDFALAFLSYVIGLLPRSAVGLFGLGRSIGWIGHAIEQYDEDQLIRPHARYVGQRPQ